MHTDSSPIMILKKRNQEKSGRMNELNRKTKKKNFTFLTY